jgi:uncharacterized BrkB/YihY/UPF0761 family membrane protein
MYNIYKASVSPGVVQQIMPILLTLRCNGTSDTWTIVRLTAAKFKHLIFPVLGFALSYVTNILVFMILYYLCLLPA